MPSAVASLPQPEISECIRDFASTNPSAVVATFGVVVTLLLFWLGARRNRMEGTFRAIEMMQEKDGRSARFQLRSVLESAADNPKGFDGLDPEVRASISSIATLFGFVGSLARRRRIYLSIYLNSFASSVVLNHRRLAEYRRWRKAVRPIMIGSLWQDFDWLALRAERYVLLRAEPSRVRRLLMRLRLAKPSPQQIEALFDETRRVATSDEVESTDQPPAQTG